MNRILLLALSLLGMAAPLRAADKPNFLFVYTDDQRWDAMGVVQREQGEKARFPWLKTPNMDRMATEGVRFRNAFVTLSLCAPSRAAFLTGRYNHLNGVANNHTAFPVDNTTHASLLKTAGYTTGYVGKWHMGNQSGKRPTFDYSASFIGQGKYFNCPIEVNGVSTPSTGWVDDVTTDYAMDFIKKNQAQPWSLAIGFKATHGPFDPPDRAKNRFAGEEARPVPNLGVRAIYLDDPGSIKIKGKKKGKGKGGKEEGEDKNEGAAAGPVAQRPTNLGYFRCISAADDNLGKLLGLLDELKLTDNTVVIFSSDNGYYLGEHGLGDKRTAYDESLRIPMIVRYPKLGEQAKGRAADQMVLNIDLMPTLLDFAGVTAPPTMQGKSWRPLLEGKESSWRDSFLFEYFKEGKYGAPTVYGVRTDTAKLIRYPGHAEWTEVFDLKADPYELKNLAADAAQKELRTKLEAEFEKQSKLVGFVIPDYADEKTGAAKSDTPAPSKRANACVLSYDFTKDDGDKVADGSGSNNAGTAHLAPVTEGREGAKARLFSGKSYIEVPKSASLDPTGGAWTVEATIKTGAPTGIILARGGPSQGYALHLDQGHAVFTVAASNTSTQVTTAEVITDEWAHLAGVITAASELQLYVNGRLAGSEKLKSFITHDPNDAMQIGADLKSQVLKGAGARGFQGKVESVRIFSGERTASEIAADSAANSSAR